jgi:hypothetical protein
VPLDVAARRHDGTRRLIGRISADGPLPPRWALSRHDGVALSATRRASGEGFGSVAVFYGCPQPLARPSLPAHDVRIDAQGESGVRVAQLRHDICRVAPEGDEDRRERVAELVRRYAARQGR